MALRDKQKDRIRHWIRVIMVFIAALLLFFAVVVPIINNAVALGVEKDLKKLPLPDKTELIESTSVAGKLSGNGNGMQYFGAVLLKSDLSLEELNSYYATYRKGFFDFLIAPQTESNISVVDTSLSFRHEDYDDGTYYVLYTWGSAPKWMWDILDTDLRGH